jgi:hypothetical protein
MVAALLRTNSNRGQNMNVEKLQTILSSHLLWLAGDPRGKCANLSGANLRGANLSGADLSDANLRGAYLPHFQLVPDTGSFEAWKKTTNGLVKLRIPASAKRTSSLVGRKCRASKAQVIAVYPVDDGPQLSHYDGVTEYRLGETIKADRWDDDIRIECTHGIHFFITRAEAEEY